MQEFLTQLLETIKTNDIFSGVALGSMVTSVFVGFLYSLKNLPGQLVLLFKRFLTVTLEINSRDRHYDSFMIWVSRFNQQNLRKYSFKTIVDTNNSGYLSAHMTYSEVEPKTCTLNIGTGRHFVWYRHRPICIEKSEEYKNTDGVIDIIRITVIGIRPKLIEAISQEIMNIATKGDLLCVCNLIENSYWKSVYKNKRFLKNFIYDRKNKIVEEIREFFRKKEWYLERGLLHKKGLLLYGPPGTGKSSFAAVIASELNLKIYYLNLSNPDVVMELSKHVSEIDGNAIILIEDIDCLFLSRDWEKTETNDHLTTLLNILDGVNSPGDVVYILTTNYIERIDKAIIRPGRIDMNIHMTCFGMDSIREMFALYYDASDFYEFHNLFGPHLPDGMVSPACLQNIFLHFPNLPDLMDALQSEPEQFRLDFIR